MDEKLPRQYPRLFPQLPISPQYGFVLPPRRGGGHPIPLLLVFIPRHVSPGHPCLEVRMVLSGPLMRGGTWLVDPKLSDRLPGPITPPRRKADPFPQGASPAITGCSAWKMGLASARVPTLSWASLSSGFGGLALSPPPPSHPSCWPSPTSIIRQLNGLSGMGEAHTGSPPP